MPVKDYLHSGIKVGRPTCCGWHHFLVGILDCVSGKRELSNCMYSSLYFLMVDVDIISYFRLLEAL